DCGDASWLRATVLNFVLPRLVQSSNTREADASPLILEVPSLENGGLTESPFTVTYHLNPNAVWSDGTPITCADIVFTEAALIDTTGNVFSPGYLLMDEPGISKVDCPDPRTVTLDFNRIDVAWQEYFGGVSGFI